MGRKTKIPRQSTINEEDTVLSLQRDDTIRYQQMVKDLVKQIEDQNSTIRAMLEINESSKNRANVSQESHLGENKFSFADIENSLNTFSGQDSYSISKWIEDLESAASVFGWSDLQKIVFGKRLLTDTAKLAVRCEGNLDTWDKLKTFLTNEFEERFNSASIHEQLRKRTKSSNETFRDYLLSIRELGSKAKLEEVAIIKYAIDGIIDDERNKIILYGAKTLSEFKEKLVEYESLVEKIRVRSKSINVSKPNRNPRIRCFKCGRTGHVASKCPEKESGNKCFACNKFGHKSFECPIKRKKESGQEIALMKERASVQNDMSKTILLNQVEIKAFVDTGSDLTFAREDKYKDLGSPKLGNPITFRGVGSNEIFTIGSFVAELEIDGYCYLERIHVVPVSILPKEFILGKTLLDRVELQIKSGNINIKPIPDADGVNCLDVTHEDELEVDHISSPHIRKQLLTLITKYEISTKPKQPHFEMNIVLTEDVPIYQQPRRLPKIENELVERQIHEWLQEGIIKPSTSEYASPIVLVTKKDGTKRLCVDYRRLNKIVVRDHQPLPLIEDQIDRLLKVNIFSTLDLRNGFFHMPIAKESQKYTAFVTPSGQYEFTRAPFGLCISPTQFQRFINCIFVDFIRQNKVLVYIDDIIVLAKDEDQAIMRLQEVLEKAASHGLDIKWSKCSFLKRRIEYLGYVIENSEISPSEEKTKAIRNFPVPKTMQQVQSFLGLTGYFRKFVRDYAIIARPLSDTLRKGNKFEIGDKQIMAFRQLITALCSHPVLAIYDPEAYTELHTDASKMGYGAILLQRNNTDQELHPVYFFSKKTSATEEKRCSYELEVLAVVMALKKFRVYLLGLKFKLVTDCAAFKATMNKREVTPKIARWAMLLGEFEYEIEHRKGSSMRHVDALSRNPTVLVVKDCSLVHKIQAAQSKDPGVKAIFEVLKFREFEEYISEGGILFKIVDGAKLLVVPKAMQYEIIRLVHERGHFGHRKMEHLISQDYYIRQLTKKITKCITNCVPCILASKTGRKEGFLHAIPKEAIPLSTYHIDHLGPMTMTKKGYRYILTVIDAFTKFVWIYALKSVTTSETLQKLRMQQATFGNPSRIISDRGTAFTSAAFQQYCNEQGIEHIKITTGVPRGNGQVERVHRVIISILTKLCTDEEERWYKHIGKVQTWLNGSYHRSIGTSPFQLLFGTKLRTAEDVNLNEAIDQELAQLFQEERDETRIEALKKICEVQEENRKTFNKKRKEANQYEVGDLVAIARTQFGTGLKIKPKYLGPYRIVRLKGNDRYDVIKVGHHEGPQTTSTVADYMKRFVVLDSDPEDSAND